MGKDKGRSSFDIITNPGGHTKNSRKSTWDKHTGARRNPGTNKPNTKSSVRERRRRNGG